MEQNPDCRPGNCISGEQLCPSPPSLSHQHQELAGRNCKTPKPYQHRALTLGQSHGSRRGLPQAVPRHHHVAGPGLLILGAYVSGGAVWGVCPAQHSPVSFPAGWEGHRGLIALRPQKLTSSRDLPVHHVSIISSRPQEESEPAWLTSGLAYHPDQGVPCWTHSLHTV